MSEEASLIVQWLRSGIRRSAPTMDALWSSVFNQGIDYCAREIELGSYRTRTDAGCDMGVGCDQSGVCYADANGQPNQCGRITRLDVSQGENRALRLRLADCRQAMHDAATHGDILDEAKRAFVLMGEAIDALATPAALSYTRQDTDDIQPDTSLVAK